jgi:hypothetical protein
MTSNADTISEQAAIDKILAELLARKLIDQSQREDLANRISGRSINAQDWRWLAEKALMLEGQNRGHSS